MDQPIAKLEGAEHLSLSDFMHEFMSIVTHNNIAHSAASQFVDLYRTYLGPTNAVPTYPQIQKLVKQANVLQTEAFAVCVCDEDLERTPLSQLTDAAKRDRKCKVCRSPLFSDKLVPKKVSWLRISY